MHLHKLSEFPGDPPGFQSILGDRVVVKKQFPLNPVLFENSLNLSGSEEYENE